MTTYDINFRRIRRKITQIPLWHIVLYQLLVVLIISRTFYLFNDDDESGKNMEHLVEEKDYNVYYNKNHSIIWVGGFLRSGTTLMRVMLSAHPDVRCGEETMMIPKFTTMHEAVVKNAIVMKHLRKVNVSVDSLENALGAYIFSIIVTQGKAAPRLCVKDPGNLRNIDLLLKIFPNSKFVLMNRDGRAVSHSLLFRHMLKGGNRGFSSYTDGLTSWNEAALSMNIQCEEAGPQRCMSVPYEQLILYPKPVTEKVLKFLNLTWFDDILHHEKFIGTDDISLSRIEPSTPQVVNALYEDALTNWTKYFPEHLKPKVATLAPMLKLLGYDPRHYPPNYSKIESEQVRLNVFYANYSVLC